MFHPKAHLLIFLLFIASTLQAQFAEEQVIASTFSEKNDIFVADFNNDGADDVLIGAERYLYIQYNIDGSGFFEQPFIIDEGDINIVSVHAADLDNDGDLDIMAASLEEGWIAYYANDGSGNFDDRVILFEDGAYASAVYAMDYDNDGDMDIFTASRESAPGPGVRLRLFRNYTNTDINIGPPTNNPNRIWLHWSTST